MDRLRRATSFVLGVWDAFNRHQAPYLAAAISYFVFFSLFPLLLGLISLLGALVSPAWAEAQVFHWIGGALPTQEAFVRQTLDAVARSRGPMGVVAIALLVWSGRGAFMSLAQALDLIWDNPPLTAWPDTLRRNAIATGCGVALGAGVLVLSSLYGALAWLGRWQPEAIAHTPLVGPVSWWLSEVVPFGGVGLVLYVAYRVLPSRHPASWCLGVGAAIAAIAWEVMRRLFGYYLANLSHFSLVYGSLSGIIALLFWIYLSGSLMLLGAEVAARLDPAFDEGASAP
jgi:membrane protein